MDLSLCIPLFNEEESLPELHDWIVRVVQAGGWSYEIIFINDGSTDRSWDVICGLREKNPNVKGISFRRNYGKSAALNEGFKLASGHVVITMDADLQDSPAEIPELYRMIREEGYHVVSGWKKKRYDPLSKTLPTKLFNWATRKMSGIYLHDFNCGLKAYLGEVTKNVEVSGELHRYIPVLAKNAGYPKIGERVVVHQARKYGTTKFGLERFVNGFLDLISLYFVGRFGKRPMHFFGTIGVLMLLTGTLSAAYLGISKLYYLSAGVRAPLVTSNPWFYISLTTMVIGVQLFLAGFIAEMVYRNNGERNLYQISEILS